MRRQSTTAVFISTVGELRQFLVPWTDECKIKGLLVNYYVQMNGDGALKVRIAADAKEKNGHIAQQPQPNIYDDTICPGCGAKWNLVKCKKCNYSRHTS